MPTGSLWLRTAVDRAQVVGATVVAAAFAILISGSAGAQQQFVYPKSAQSPEQQQRDEYECYRWAVSKTGYDPSQPPPPATAAPTASQQQPQGGQVARGAMRGAAGGAAIGAISGGDKSDAAIAGAVLGGLRGRMQMERQRQAQAQQQQAAQQQAQAAQGASRANYNNARAACLEARGYVVR